MNITIINNNIIYVYRERIEVSLDTLKANIIEVYTDQNPNPTLAQFPGVTVVSVPQIQKNIIIENDKLIITDQSIGNIGGRDILKFVTLAKKVTDHINKEIVSYGYNFIYDVEDDSFSNMVGKIKRKFFKTTLNLPSEASLNFALPNISFQYSGASITIKFLEFIDNVQNNPTNILKVNVNIHYNNQPGDLANLKTDYESKEEYVRRYIENILT